MRLAGEGWREEWQTLFAILMSARTRDETTVVVGEKLFAKYPTLAALASARAADVAALIRPVNFYHNKTKNILAAATMLYDDLGGAARPTGRRQSFGRVPHDIEKLVTIPGVGRKTANVFLAEFGHDSIGVDTHVSYISQKLGWTMHKDPAKIEKDLEALFPQKYWRTVNNTCVRFGKTHTSRREKDALLAEIANQ